MRGNVQKRSSSKAAALLTRGAYSQYVSASGAKRQVCEPEGQAKWRPQVCASRPGKARERRWRLFSTFPPWIYSRRLPGLWQGQIR